MQMLPVGAEVVGVFCKSFAAQFLFIPGKSIVLYFIRVHLLLLLGFEKSL